MTALNRIIETASFTIPSPKTTLKSFGYLSELIKVKAATESVAHIVAEYKRIYLLVSPTVPPSYAATLMTPKF